MVKAHMGGSELVAMLDNRRRGPRSSNAILRWGVWIALWEADNMVEGNAMVGREKGTRGSVRELWEAMAMVA